MCDIANCIKGARRTQGNAIHWIEPYCTMALVTTELTKLLGIQVTHWTLVVYKVIMAAHLKTHIGIAPNHSSWYALKFAFILCTMDGWIDWHHYWSLIRHASDLNITLEILLGMGTAAGSELAAAVSNAGGLGVIGGWAGVRLFEVVSVTGWFKSILHQFRLYTRNASKKFAKIERTWVSVTVSSFEFATQSSHILQIWTTRTYHLGLIYYYLKLAMALVLPTMTMCVLLLVRQCSGMMVFFFISNLKIHSFRRGASCHNWSTSLLRKEQNSLSLPLVFHLNGL